MQFDDKAIVLQNHKRIAYVTMYGCDPGQHITMIEVGYRDNHDPSTIIRDIVYHGGHSELGKKNLKLDRNEWFIQIRTSTWEHKITNPITWHTRTRIGNIEMFTNNGHSISCGAYLLSGTLAAVRCSWKLTKVDPTVIDKPEMVLYSTLMVDLEMQST